MCSLVGPARGIAGLGVADRWRVEVDKLNQQRSGDRQDQPPIRREPVWPDRLYKGRPCGVRPRRGQPKTPASPFTDADRIALFHTLSAASGTYKVEGNTLTVTYTTSWNQTWTGVTQRRQIEIAGNKLTITSEPVKSTQTGKDIIFVATYERVE